MTTQRKQRGLTYKQWRALGLDAAVKYMAKQMKLNADRQRKLANILRAEWDKS